MLYVVLNDKSVLSVKDYLAVLIINDNKHSTYVSYMPKLINLFFFSFILQQWVYQFIASIHSW